MSGQTPQAGMTAEQAAEAGQAMLASAKAQKEQIAQGFHAQRQAVLDQVARQQSEVPTPQDLGAGLPPRDPAAAPSQPPTFTQAEIDAALRALGGAGAPPAPAAGPAAGAGRAPAGQMLVMAEIAQTIRALVAAEVRAQLAAAGVAVPQAGALPGGGEKTATGAAVSRHNQDATPSGY